MDTNTLVDDNLIQDGQKLVDELPQRGFEVAAAFWINLSEDNRWYFYIVSPVVDTDGIAEGYRRLNEAIRALPRPLSSGPFKITLIGPSNPIAQGVLEIYRRAPQPRVSPIHWRGIRLGNKSVEKTYIYAPPVPPT